MQIDKAIVYFHADVLTCHLQLLQFCWIFAFNRSLGSYVSAWWWQKLLELISSSDIPEMSRSFGFQHFLASELTTRWRLYFSATMSPTCSMMLIWTLPCLLQIFVCTSGQNKSLQSIFPCFNPPTSHFLRKESRIKGLLRLFHSRTCCYARALWLILRKALFALLTLQLSWQQITYIGKERKWWWGVFCLVHN